MVQDINRSRIRPMREIYISLLHFDILTSFLPFAVSQRDGNGLAS